MATSIQLSNIPHADGTDARRMYLTEAAQHDAEICINKISDNVVDAARFSDPQEFHAAYQYTVTVAHKIAPRVASSIVHYFSLKLSTNDLSNVIFPWILHFIQAVYDRYTSILRCVTKLPGSIFLTASPSFFVDKNTQNAMNSLANNDELNLLLYSDIIRYFSFKHINKFHLQCRFDSPVCSGHATTRNRVQGISAHLTTLYGNFLQRNIHVSVGCYGVPSGNFYSALTSRIINTSTFIRLDGNQAASPWRKRKIESFPSDNDFESLLCNLIPNYIPTELCESLQSIVAGAKQISLPRRGVLATSVGPYADVPLMVIAKIADRPLAVVTHGGGDMMKDITQQTVERSVSSRVYGFGAACHFFLPSPFLATAVKSGGVLPPVFIVNNSYRFLPCLMPLFGNGTWRPYAQQQVRFLKAIEPQLRPVMRMHVRDTFSVADKMRGCFPGLVVQNYKDIHIEEVLSKSILVVLDHCTTTLHRTMALNRPTILYSDANIFKDKAMGVIEPMRSVGIWHDSPESAAAFYANLIATSSSSWDKAKKAVDDWWFSSDVQKVRELFCENYAMTSNDWGYHWEKAFDALADEF